MTNFTFKLPLDLLRKFRERCGLISMSKIMRLLIEFFVNGQVSIEDLEGK